MRGHSRGSHRGNHRSLCFGAKVAKVREGKNPQAQVAEVGKEDTGDNVKDDGVCQSEFMTTQKSAKIKGKLTHNMLLINSYC